MQSRFWISTHDTYEGAQRAKSKAAQDNPGETYQIRRGADKGKEVFRLVQRFKVNEARVVNETKKKKKGKKREDFSWVRS